VNAPGSKNQHLWVLALSQSVDDTAWSTSWHGAFFATDHDADNVDVINGSFWPGTAFVAVTPCGANNAPATCPGRGFPANYVGHSEHVQRPDQPGVAARRHPAPAGPDLRRLLSEHHFAGDGRDPRSSRSPPGAGGNSMPGLSFPGRWSRRNGLSSSGT